MIDDKELKKAIKAVAEVFEKYSEAIRKAIRKVISFVRQFWVKIRKELLKTKEGRRILSQIVLSNNWRKTHGIPMIRRN